MTNILGTICARGGSKGVKNKNIRPILSKPLIAYTIEQAKACGLFSHVVVSTDSDEIADAAIKYGAEVFFKREPHLASDEAGKVESIRDALIRSENFFQTKFDYQIDLDATSPLRNISDITESFAQFLANDNDNLITAAPARRSPYFNLVELDENGKVMLSKKPEKPILSRQKSPKCFDMNASIYIWKREIILKENSIFLEKTGLFVMPEERSLDIDNELDFQIVEFLMKNKLLKNES